MTSNAPQRGPLWGRTAASQKRRLDILHAGKSVFFQNGYQLASVDRIAAAAGTTKRTVYDHFGAKEALFCEVVAFASRQFVDSLPKVEDLPASPAQGLTVFTHRIRQLLGSADTIRFQRLVIAEAERQPELGQVLYETAVVGAEHLLRDYLSACVAAGDLAPHDVAQSARMVMAVATSAMRLRALMGVKEAADDPLGAQALSEIIGLVTKAHAPTPLNPSAD